ncbi:thioredoxin [Bacteroidales bacterium OttesenSCG-928-I21]|nr:thioredoxin [Bacteroidales bacterium OttesenSCG-928-I21]
MALEINEQNFEELVLNSDKPVVLDFWAVWCGPCRMIAPHIDQLSEEYEGKAIIGKVDVDNSTEIAAKYSVRNIPTVIYLKNGEVVDKVVGAVPKDALKAKLDAIL